MLLEDLAQHDMLAAEMVAVRFVPGRTRFLIEQMNGNRQLAVGLGVVGVDLYIHGLARSRAQVGDGADDAEAGFLMIGGRAEGQVDQLRALGREMLHGWQDPSEPEMK
ncbi:hypothetical protein D3C73_1319190 [compost metagenome]